MKRHGIQQFATWERTINGRNGAIQSYHQNQDMDIFVKPRHRALGDVIQDLVDAYNHSRHRSISMAPADVQKKNENRLWVCLIGDGDTYLKPPIQQEEMVRVSSHKNPFWQGLHAKLDQGALYSESGGATKKRTKRRVYKLVDYNDDAV